jgi:diaminohydroxyphosphoribosylaminopyrimidine deaminase/5-amino-6-(5-phosphoribosylamino)uracil reductase
MARALELAVRGVGAVEPNPPVGAVIVAPDGRQIAAGWHRRFGGPHAEADALADAAARGADVRGAAMYVTLEPCTAFGGKKTPPCADALIAAGLRRVVVAMPDPDANVSGRGIARLRDAGIDVAVGLCQAAAGQLLAPYVKLRTLRRPWVIAKWAQTADGFLALPPGAGRWISSEASRRRAHELRAICDAVAVGIGTVLADDPLLTNRSGVGRTPARVVLDTNLRIPAGCKLVATAATGGPATGPAGVIVATTAAAVEANREKAAELRSAGVELLELPSPEGAISLPALLDALGRRAWTRLLIEGGARLLAAVLEAELADEVWAFISPGRLGPAGKGLPRLDLKETLQRHEAIAMGGETLQHDVLRRFRMR